MDSQPCIFVIDDEPLVCRAICELAAFAGYAVRSFASADDFLKQYDPEMAGCIITDVRMPGMSGRDLQRALNERKALLPVILVTGHADVATAVEAMREGALSFLMKPYDPPKLMSLVREALMIDAQRRADESDRRQLAQRLQMLTPREHEVLDRLIAGDSLKQIAAACKVTIPTACRRRMKVLRKMQVENDVELTRLVMGRL